MSGARKRKKKREKEEAVERARADVERLKLGPTAIWNGLVVHRKDVFVSHVVSKLNRTDRFFFSEVNGEGRGVLTYAGVNVSGLGYKVYECTSISTLEWLWNHIAWGEEDSDGYVMDQALFCEQVSFTNKLELLKWAREEKKCEWDKWTINSAAYNGNLEILKYCFSNDCPCDEEESCKQAASGGNLDCLLFLFDKVKPSRETEEEAAHQAAGKGHTHIMKYFVEIEERKICDKVKQDCMATAAKYGGIDCLKYLVEEAKVPIDWQHVAGARYYEQPECVNYLQEKGCPEPTDEQYAMLVEIIERQQGS